MFGVIFYSDRQLDCWPLKKVQIVKSNIFIDAFWIAKYPVLIDGNNFQKSKLSACNRPIFRWVSTATIAKIAGRGESKQFNLIHVNGNIAWPLVIVTACFWTDLKREWDFGYKFILFFGLIRKVISYKAFIEPKIFSVYSFGVKKLLGSSKSNNCFSALNIPQGASMWQWEKCLKASLQSRQFGYYAQWVFI